MIDPARPLAVGLVGTGPWADKVHAPMLAAGPETRLAAVWSRRPEAARTIASAHGTVAAASFEALLEQCDAVAFAVPPDVQAALGIRAARASKHLLLDKPLSLTLGGARELAAAVDEAGVVTQMMLTHRYRPTTAAFLVAARAFETVGARLGFLSGAFVRGPYADSWRKDVGVLHDLGPHAFDLLEAAVGPIVDVRGHGDPRRWVSLTCAHANGAVSELALSGVMNLPGSFFRLDLYGPAGALEFDAVAASADDPWPAARRSFAEAVRRGRSGELDVHHGVRLQELIDLAARALRP
jgi:predicted dehydrogenase